jgi:RNA polymerase sigma-70 factor (ECF subfamily)
VDPSPVVALNRAAARGMRDGPEAGLAAIEAVLERGGSTITIWPTPRPDMQRRLGLAEAARASYQRALELTRQPAERRFLQARLAQLAAGHTPTKQSTNRE